MIIKIIKNILTSVLNTTIIEIINESKKHKTFMNNHHSHFKIIIVSNDFIKYSLIKRHQKIYYLLSKCISQYKIHGLALHAYTIDEWNKKFDTNLISPICVKSHIKSSKIRKNKKINTFNTKRSIKFKNN
ncbi:MAG: BolA family protein [Buchnera aphidicola (Kaburagia rhusicola ensigallis)]